MLPFEFNINSLFFLSIVLNITDYKQYDFIKFWNKNKTFDCFRNPEFTKLQSLDQKWMQSWCLSKYTVELEVGNKIGHDVIGSYWGHYENHMHLVRYPKQPVAKHCLSEKAKFQNYI